MWRVKFLRVKRLWADSQWRWRLLTYLSAGIFISIVAGTLLITAVFAIFSLDLPNPNKVIRRDGYATIIYDRNGKALYDVYNDAHRIPLDLKDIPQYLRQATIAIEDKEFYQHQGFSLRGIARSAINILTFKGIRGGGSTLTQQLVKNVLLTSERSLARKIKEVILANQIEKRFTKDEILQMYLNEAPYGGATYGVESAARTYFGKSARDLNLVESAILAGLPQSPTYYSPAGKYPKAYIDRTKDVLRRMREDGYITPQQEIDAVKQLANVQFATQSGALRAPHFVFYVKDLLTERFGAQMVESGGLRVTTTLDWDLQEKAEKIVNEEIKKIKNLKVSNGAAVVLNPKSGEILSMVGSYDYFDKNYGSYNVTTALRQPGSAGKPFIYAVALAKNYTAATLLTDVKTEFPSGEKDKPNYVPENYDNKYRGPVQMRFALGNSLNTTAVKMTALVGLKEIMQAGFNAGISTWEPTDENMRSVGLSLALGGREVKLLELVGAYGAFANGGTKVEPQAILKVQDAKGKILYEYRPIPGKRVFSEEVSFLISHILSDNDARKDVFGENNLLQISGRTVAVKTGTTDKKRDNWTVGYDPGNIVVGVWVGNNDNTAMAPAITSGVTGAAPIWHKIMKVALANIPPKDFAVPESILSMTIDAFGGGLPKSGEATRTEYFVKGTEPITVGPIYKKLKISKNNGKLANEMEIKLGNYEEKEFIVITESDPVSEEGKNRWQEAIDKWIAENKKDDERYHPPKEVSDADLNTIKILVDSPQDRSRIDGYELPIKAKVLALRNIIKFTVEIDGVEKISKTTDIIDEKIVGLTSGKHTVVFKATDTAGNSTQMTHRIGINQDWDYSPLSTSSAVLKRDYSS